MKKFLTSRDVSRRAFLFGGALTAGVVLSEGMRLLQTDAAKPVDLESLTPDLVGPWQHVRGHGIILPRDSQPSRFYEQELARVYLAEGLPSVMLAIAYAGSQDERLEVHRPESCYPAQGFAIEQSELTEVSLANHVTLPARLLLARRHDRAEQIVYWTRIGESFPRTAAEQKIASLNALLRRQTPDGLLFRMSLIGEQKSDLAFLHRFARELFASSPAALRHALAGGLPSTGATGTDVAHG